MKSYKEVYKMVKKAYDFTQMHGNDANYNIMNQQVQYKDLEARNGDKVRKDSKPAPFPSPKDLPTRKTPSIVRSYRDIIDYYHPKVRQTLPPFLLQRSDPSHPMYNRLVGLDLDLRTRMSADYARQAQWLKNPERVPMVYRGFPSSLTAVDRLKILNNSLRHRAIYRDRLY